MSPRDNSGSDNSQRNSNYRPILPPEDGGAGGMNGADQTPLTMGQLTMALSQWHAQIQGMMEQISREGFAPIQPMLLQIQERIQQLQTQLLETQEQMHESQTQVIQMLASTDAYWRNVNIMHFNKEAFTNFLTNNGESCALEPCLKVAPGLGPGLPGHPPEESLVGTQPAPVGTPCPASLFPATCHEWSALTNQQISNLAAWQNQSFEIRDDDDMPMRRRKVKCHISTP